MGYTTYGEHTARLCGLEVVLPSGELLRTGMGAMSGSPTWNLYRYGFGPSWEQMFVQSNYGVVTKAGIWLMPAPESMVGLDLELDNADDLGWAVDVVRRHAPRRPAAAVALDRFLAARRGRCSPRARSGTTSPGALPDDVIAAIRKRFNIGWWSISLRLYGYESVNEAAAGIIQAQFAKQTKQAMTVHAPGSRASP